MLGAEQRAGTSMRSQISHALHVARERIHLPHRPEQARTLPLQQFSPTEAQRDVLHGWGVNSETYQEQRYGWSFHRTINSIRYDLTVNQRDAQVRLRSRWGHVELALDGVESFKLQPVDQQHDESLSFSSKNGAFEVTNFGTTYEVRSRAGATSHIDLNKINKIAPKRI